MKNKSVDLLSMFPQQGHNKTTHKFKSNIIQIKNDYVKLCYLSNKQEQQNDAKMDKLYIHINYMTKIQKYNRNIFI